MLPKMIPLGFYSIFLLFFVTPPATVGQLHTLPGFRDFGKFLPWFGIPCGKVGEACCEPPVPGSPTLGVLVKCNEGLGCNIKTKKCVSPCGKSGAVCCDGPETRALGWTRTGAIFSPTRPGLKEMCDAGNCDKTSHRCVACSSGPGTPCCPPDASQATARCFGDHLECRFDAGSGLTSGTCFTCGGIGNPPCGGVCDFPLELRNGMCVECGRSNQPVCEYDFDCNRGCAPHFTATAANGVCVPCGDLGQGDCGVHDRSRRPCANYVDWDHCKPGLGLLNGLCQNCGSEGNSRCSSGCNPGLNTKGGLCTAFCGHLGQPACDDSTCTSPLQSIQGVCKTCGVSGNPPCPRGGCSGPLKPKGGLCTLCGSDGQPQCDAGCDRGLLLQGGSCSSSCGTDHFPRCDSGCRGNLVLSPEGFCRDPNACAKEGEACYVGDAFPGAGPFCCGDQGLLFCRLGYCRR